MTFLNLDIAKATSFAIMAVTMRMGATALAADNTTIQRWCAQVFNVDS